MAEYTISTNTSNDLYYDFGCHSSTDFTITWYDSNGFNIQLSSLEQMKQDFETLKNKFFEDYPKRRELFDMRAMREERLTALMQ